MNNLLDEYDQPRSRTVSAQRASELTPAPPSTLEELTRRAGMLVDRLGDVGRRLSSTADRVYGETPEVRDKAVLEGPPYAGQMGELFRQLEEANIRLGVVEYAAHRLDTVA